MAPKKKLGSPHEVKVTLKTIATRLGLTPGTVSAALNDSAAARSISEATKQRIFQAAKELNYHPNFFARSLRLQRTFTIGVIAEEIGDAYGAMVINGVEGYLRKHNYFFLTVIHRHNPQLLQAYSQLLLQRGVEGVTNITLDHKLAARLALSHLVELGHEEIAFLKGHPSSSDSAVRWSSICEVAAELGVRIRPELTVQIDSTVSTPELGYPFAKQLLARRQPFSALFAYNDVSAIGTTWAFREAGLRIPEDISVVGFDDIPGAAYANPGLTTVRQPLQRMGQIAAQCVIDQIEGVAEYVPEIAIEPELIVRASSGPAPSLFGGGKFADLHRMQQD